ncbi:hypothetical protein FHS34_001674 [Streptomyces echinatus]|uniref:Uncharacterized protein n=1 Tax=Streptomyces echinatus TaxID=67293 RepID=A0A7W9UPC8_9ACTN|nr:hypothetical protein [Streptomyces echinatus]
MRGRGLPLWSGGVAVAGTSLGGALTGPVLMVR